MSAVSVAYPSTLAEPIVAGFRNAAEMGVQASNFRPGRTRAARRFPRPGQSFVLKFLMPADDFAAWETWAIENDPWHPRGIILSLPSFATGAGLLSSNHDVRFVSPLQINYRDDKTVEVTVSARVTIGGDGVLPESSSVYSARSPIQGGSPAAPSAGGPIQGGSPAAPSADNIIQSGSPANVV